MIPRFSAMVIAWVRWTLPRRPVLIEAREDAMKPAAVFAIVPVAR
jgi:hypothetical protein